MASNMFVAAANAASSQRNKPLVSFKAGRMNHDKVGAGPRLRIRADPRRGEVRLVRSAEGLMTLQWRDRSTAAVEQTWDVFPGDITFKRVRTGKEEDRVYELAFVAARDRRFFFWMQESSAEKDGELATKLLTTINSPPPIGAEAGAEAGGDPMAAMLASLMGGAGGGAGGGAARGAPARSAAAPLTAQQLQTMFSGLGGAPRSPVTGTPAPAPPAARPPPIGGAQSPAPASASQGQGQGAPPIPSMEGLDDDPELAAALAMSMQEESSAPAPAPAPGPAPPPSGSGSGSGSASGSSHAAGSAIPPARTGGLTADDIARAMAAVGAAMGSGGDGGGATGSGGFTLRGSRARVHPTPINAILDADVIIPLLRESAAMRAALLPLLPPGQQTDENLYDILRSPQLRQAASSLTGALGSATGGDSNAIFTNFGLNPVDGDAEMASGDPIAALVAAIQAAVNRGRTGASGGSGSSSAPAPPS